MRGRARAVLAVGITSVAMLAAACGGGGETPPATGEGGQTGGEIVITRLHAGEPVGPGQHQRDLWRQRDRRVHRQAGALQHRDRCSRDGHRREHRDHGQPELHGQAQAGYKFQDGTDVKAKNFVDAWNYTAYGPNGQAGRYFFDPIEGYADLQCGADARRVRLQGQGPEGQGDDRSEGRRRHHLHHQDHRARSPTCPCGSATRRSRRCPTRSSPIPRRTRRSRSAPVRSRSTRSATPRSC